MSGGAAAPREFAVRLAADLLHVAGDALIGVYLHGSAVYGDWNERGSDVDVLVIVADGVEASVVRRMAEALTSGLACPGAGLEGSIVGAADAAAPADPWPFLVHATTVPDDRKVVWGVAGRGDVDLVLHYAAARGHGWTAFGPPPDSVIGAISGDVMARVLAGDLRWGVDNADASYAVLNACRALRYRDERVLCSKTEGGEWALARSIEPELVRGALDARGRGERAPMTDAVKQWVLSVAVLLER